MELKNSISDIKIQEQIRTGRRKIISKHEKSQLKLSWGKEILRKMNIAIKNCEELSIPEISEIRVKKRAKE